MMKTTQSTAPPQSSELTLTRVMSPNDHSIRRGVGVSTPMPCCVVWKVSWNEAQDAGLRPVGHRTV